MDVPDPISAANYADFFVHLAVDVVAFVILGVLTYYRRHGRIDFLICMAAFNIGLFVVLAVIDVRSTSLGVGFGLFALLSIISLRSDPFSLIELGYFFTALVVGVVNALEVGGRLLNPANELFAAALTAVVVIVVYVVDHPRLRRASGRQQITLDRVHADPAALHADLEQRLGVVVKSASVLHTNYVEETMLVDVRYVDGDGRRPAKPVERLPTAATP